MTQTLKLYEAVDALEIALQWMEEHEEEIAAAGGEIPEALLDLLEQAEGDTTNKVGRTALAVQNLKRNAEGAKAEAERLRSLAASWARQADLLTSYLQWQLQRVALLTGTARIETPLAKVRLQKNGRPSVRPIDPNAIPEQFQRVRVEFDGEKAYQYLKENGCIPEPEDGPIVVQGLVVERGVHVRIQ
jgi:hypothetical protein